MDNSATNSHQMESLVIYPCLAHKMLVSPQGVSQGFPQGNHTPALFKKRRVGDHLKVWRWHTDDAPEKPREVARLEATQKNKKAIGFSMVFHRKK